MPASIDAGARGISCRSGSLTTWEARHRRASPLTADRASRGLLNGFPGLLAGVLGRRVGGGHRRPWDRSPQGLSDPANAGKPTDATLNIAAWQGAAPPPLDPRGFRATGGHRLHDPPLHGRRFLPPPGLDCAPGAPRSRPPSPLYGSPCGPSAPPAPSTRPPRVGSRWPSDARTGLVGGRPRLRPHPCAEDAQQRPRRPQQGRRAAQPRQPPAHHAPATPAPEAARSEPPPRPGRVRPTPRPRRPPPFPAAARASPSSCPPCSQRLQAPRGKGRRGYP